MVVESICAGSFMSLYIGEFIGTLGDFQEFNYNTNFLLLSIISVA